MSKRDELITKYAADLKDKCGVTPDMDLLTKVTIGCGPAIYNKDAATVSGTDETELATVKNNFLIKKLGLADSADLDKGIDAVIEKYGRSISIPEFVTSNDKISLYLFYKYFKNSKDFFTFTGFKTSRNFQHKIYFHFRKNFK